MNVPPFGRTALVGLFSVWLSAVAPARVEIIDAQTPSARFLVRFSYSRHPALQLPASEAVHSIHVAGSWNEWNAAAHPMHDDNRDGVWETTLWLEEGVYEYKFVVNGTVWTEDPENPEQVANDYGSVNSVLGLGAYAFRSNAVASDGVIDATAVAHVPASAEYVHPAGTDAVVLRLRTRANDVKSCTVLVWDDTGTLRRVPAQLSAQDRAFQFHDALIPFNGQRLRYSFLLEGDWCCDRTGVRACDHSVEPSLQPFVLNPEMFPRIAVPGWAQHVVWYQIMLDRFRNGTPANDYDQTVPWTHDWFEPAAFERHTYTTRDPGQGSRFYWVVWHRKYGGDVQGLMEQLGYLRDLGVTALYLNPVFESPSDIKYNTADFRHIDPHLTILRDATEQALVEQETLDPTTWHWTRGDLLWVDMIRLAHAHGLRVIIDGVFNHVGEEFWAFRDVRQRKAASPYAAWFKVRSWEPFEYEGWAGFGGLPELARVGDNFHPQVRRHLLDITRRWMDPNGDGDTSDGIDGWRLDVADLVPPAFWNEWRALVREINPQALIVGEIWSRATAWVVPRGPFDAVMNYEFLRRVYRFFIDTDPPATAAEFDRSLHELLRWYPWDTALALQNLLDSHDTDRIASAIVNPNRGLDQANRLQDSGPNYRYTRPGPAAYRRLALIVTFQMTFPGAPMIWYGDEVGMWGADDPTCRKPMLWRDLEPYADPDEHVMPQIHAHYRTMIALRNRFVALRNGAFQTAIAEGDVYGYFRRTATETLLILLNRGAAPAMARVRLAEDLPRLWYALPLEDSWRGERPVAGLEGRHKVYTAPLAAGTAFTASAKTLFVPLEPVSGAVLLGVYED